LFSELTYTTNGTAPIAWSSSGTFPGGVATTYQKYAGDPNYYILQASVPYYTHPTPGTYYITLTATDSVGSIGTFAVTITVNPATNRYDANNYWVMQMAGSMDYGTNVYSNNALAYWDGVAVAQFSFSTYSNGVPYELQGRAEAGSGGTYNVGLYVSTDVNGFHLFRIILQ
jgi:hypothetical protein